MATGSDRRLAQQGAAGVAVRAIELAMPYDGRIGFRARFTGERFVRTFGKIVVAVAVVAGGVLAAFHLAPAGAPFHGNWKLILLPPSEEITLCLLKIGDDAAKPTIEVLDELEFAAASADEARVEDNVLRFRLRTKRGPYQIAVALPTDGAPPPQLLGCFRNRGPFELMRLERTSLKELDAKKTRKRAPGGPSLQAALEANDPRQAEQGVRLVLEKYGDQPVSQAAALALLQLQLLNKASLDDVKATSERALAVAAPYGREIELQAALQLAHILANVPAERGGQLALDHARRAEQLLLKSDPPPIAVAVLKTLAKALRANNRAEEAKAAADRVADLDAKLDEEFRKNAVPFRPELPAGRRGGSDRVVLCELFTGAQCGPCVAADVAFDAALQVYKPSQAIFLQYHVHIPRVDPLTSPACDARLKYYGEAIGGTPTYLLDGKAVEQEIGGPAEAGESSYGELRNALDQAMNTSAEAQLKLTARRMGDTIALDADVANLRKPGPRTFLRFALTEELVHYAASNGQRLHHHIVRAMPGGPTGFALPEKSAKQSVTADLAAVRLELQEYLTTVDRRKPFPDDERPLELKHLKAVAFIQDDTTKDVLQATQVDVPEAQ